MPPKKKKLTRSTALSPAFQRGDGRRRSGSTLSKPRHLRRGAEGLTEPLKRAINTLIVQEVRVLQLEQACTPSFVLQDISRSILEAKKQISDLALPMTERERESLLKGAFLQSVDEQIERTTELRRNRCLRCIHVRYFDEKGSCCSDFPVGELRVHGIGCVIDRQTPGIHCKEFAQRRGGISLQDYLGEMTLLYELRAMFEELEEVWGYLKK